ncbi:unnamed protein product [Cyclocybe aegerita]|uniref:Uncharacterized protein n=1 Tax=Cyclocybe aegerita TaxID=1973307 RepID=A0A8S0WH35_CYCAE|nr:unnamed protein product [Cyclocybe aegerita]
MVDPLTRYMGTVGSSVQEAWLVIPNSVTALQNMASIDFTPLTQIEVLHLEGLLITHQNSPQPLEAFFQKLFAELCSSPTDHSETCRPSLQRMSISLTVDTKHGAHSFFGIPDYVLLQPFTWFGLPSIIEEAFSSVAASLISSSSSSSWNPSPLLPTSSSLDLLKDLQVELKLKAPSIAASQRSLSEEYVREGVWKGFEERGKLQVVFVDEDSDRGRGSL